MSSVTGGRNGVPPPTTTGVEPAAEEIAVVV